MQEQRLYEGILEHRDSGEVVVGDGSFLFSLEKRGYVKAGLWTPEAVAERPNAGREKNNSFVVRHLHMDLMRVGSNVMQTFTFSASEENMDHQVNCNVEGASMVGVNFRFGPRTSLKTMRLMKEGLQAAGLKAHLMVQPWGFTRPTAAKEGLWISQNSPLVSSGAR
ncbi:S-methylmethionine--homocysteine S-methyltransferase BHMT2 [Camelus dromedarius]|uniref:S-methylmethionine--homocysteine S-methyltransferase BHMT2 n=1 Tax=Camelus dromedarius TaxID=9838 RepID=A0A5N4ECF6_CAMDR|nr:S-methylmethionine--homocysteine S-methyltransferase BHMT2 [Camelus dromedarius]